MAAAPVAGWLSGCTWGRREPSPEAVETARRLGDVLAGISDVREVLSCRAVTHPRTDKQEIAAVVTVVDDLSRADLLQVGRSVRAALADHLVDGYETQAGLRSTRKSCDTNWRMNAQTSAETLSYAVDAMNAEIKHGSTVVSVDLDDTVSSMRHDISSAALLAETPTGMRLASRWVTGQPADLTVAVHRGESPVSVPLEQLAPRILSAKVKVNLVLMEGRLTWKLTPLASKNADDPQLIAAVTPLLAALRAVPRTSRIEVSGPWWVSLECTDTVRVVGWRTEECRASAEQVVTAVLDRANR